MVIQPYSGFGEPEGLPYIFALTGNYLRARGACPYCMLRYFSCRVFDYYQENRDTLMEKVNAVIDKALEGKDAPSVDVSPTSRCPCCLGILPRLMSLEFRRELIDTILHTGFQFKDYQLLFTLPPTLLTRRFVMAYELHDYLLTTDVDKEEVVAFRDLLCSLAKSFDMEEGVYSFIDEKATIKWACGSPVGNGIGRRFNPESPFRLQITVKADETANIPDPNGPGKRKFRRRAPTPTDRTPPANDLNMTTAFLRRADQAEVEAAFPRAALLTEPATHAEFAVTCSNSFVVGRYRKLGRDVSQSAWTPAVKGPNQRSIETSVGSVIGDAVMAATGAEDNKFHSAGREDIDVRMLGNGRPFLIELINPKTPFIDYKAVEAAINAEAGEGGMHAVEVEGLGLADPTIEKIVHDGEGNKKKHYVAVVYSSTALTTEDIEKVNALGANGDIMLGQRTPLRVLHRRTLMTRDRAVHSLTLEAIPGAGGRFMVLRLITQAGTYVKEFVHGDFGRTTPHLGSIIDEATAHPPHTTRCAILQLDVERVDLDLPALPDAGYDEAGYGATAAGEGWLLTRSRADIPM